MRFAAHSRAARPSTIFGGQRLALFFLCLGFLCGCSSEPMPWQTELRGEAMGTTWSVKIVTLGRPDTEREQFWGRVVTERLEEVNTLMSTYRDDSEISRLNAAPAGTAVGLSAPTVEVLELSRRISEESGGAFDITVGPAVDAWGFGAAPFENPPAESVLSQLRERIDWQRIELAETSATKGTNDVETNLSAVAKGYAVDRVAEALLNVGENNVMVEVGGEVRVSGHNVSEASWRVAVERPEALPNTVHRIVELDSGCLATSGDYRNSYEWEGQRYSHTIDPRTASPVAHELASVSVHHPSCADADAYATTLMVLGPEEGLRFAQERNLASLFLVYSEDDGVAESMTDAFAELLHPES